MREKMAREKPRIRVDKFLNATGRIVNSGPVKAHGLILPSADQKIWKLMAVCRITSRLGRRKRVFKFM